MLRRLLVNALVALALLGLVASPIQARTLDFDGSTGEIAYKGFEALSGATSLTWMAWVNLDAVAVRTWFLNDPGGTAFSVGIDNATGNAGLRFSTHSNSGVLSIAATPPLGVWTHVAVRFDGTFAAGSRSRFYIDGLLQGGAGENTGTVMGTVASTTAFVVGDAITSNANGRMFNMKVFINALSQEQIEAEMRCYRPQADGLLFWIPMDTGDKVVPDYAGGRGGVPTAGVTVSDSTPPLDYCGGG